MHALGPVRMMDLVAVPRLKERVCEAVAVAGGDGGGRSNQQIAGKYLFATGSQDYGTDFNLGFLGYEIQMRAGTAQGGALSGRTMVSPALDDVTLSVYLPSARYLISEVLE